MNTYFSTHFSTDSLNMHQEFLRPLLDSFFEKYSLEPLLGGGTDAKLFSIHIADGNNFVVKIQTQSLQNEYLNYQFLQEKVPVPHIHFYQTWHNQDVLCMTQVKGKVLGDCIGVLEDTEIVRRYAHALKQLHEIPILNAPILQSTQQKVMEAGIRVTNQLVDIEDLEEENQEIGITDLYKKLCANIPQKADLVFTHGDYCFDNLLFDDTKLTGFIDIGRGGIADKYQDIALAVRSIRGELSEELLPLFFETYGISEISREKIDFFLLLDEFF